MRTPAEFRTALADGRSLLGLWATIPSSLTTEAAALSGVDYVVVDEQHGAVDRTLLLGMLQAIQTGGAVPLVRVARLDPWVIGSALDLGAAGVIVPLIETPEQAAQAVAACRYAPAGSRSWGPLRADMAIGSARPDDLGDGPVCLVMIETRTGLDAVEEIARTPGLDGIYVGPSDLALTFGLAPTLRLEHPPVLDAIERVRRECKKAGVIAGLHCLGGEDAARFAGPGFGMVTVGGDLLFLRDALARAVAVAREGARGN
jgi:4-hydroxy-2-oxoheptanedioate aldolase